MERRHADSHFSLTTISATSAYSVWEYTVFGVRTTAQAVPCSQILQSPSTYRQGYVRHRLEVRRTATTPPRSRLRLSLPPGAILQEGHVLRVVERLDCGLAALTQSLPPPAMQCSEEDWEVVRTYFTAKAHPGAHGTAH